MTEYITKEKIELLWENNEKNSRKDLLEILKARAELHPLVGALPVPPPDGSDFALTLSCAHKMEGDFNKQAMYLKRIVDGINSIYPIYGLFYYEVYKDLRTLHIHGIIRFHKITLSIGTLDKIKREFNRRTFFLINKRLPDKQDKWNNLIDIKPINGLRGWMNYCEKQQHVIKKLDIHPFIIYPKYEIDF